MRRSSVEALAGMERFASRRTGSSVDGQADALLGLGEASGSSGVRSQERGRRKAECPSGTGGVEAAQTLDGEIEPNGLSKGE